MNKTKDITGLVYNFKTGEVVEFDELEFEGWKDRNLAKWYLKNCGSALILVDGKKTMFMSVEASMIAAKAFNVVVGDYFRHNMAYFEAEREEKEREEKERASLIESCDNVVSIRRAK